MKYAAIIKSYITIPGDERSRTHPGHGYPEHSEETITMVEFEHKPAMEAWLKDRVERYHDRTNYRLIQYEELKVETTISVKVTP